MNKIIKLLENKSFDAVRDEILAPENEKALKALIDSGCVKATRAWNGEIVHLQLLDHSATYTLERQEIWLNRLYGFISGVLVTVAAELIVRAISLLLFH